MRKCQRYYYKTGGTPYGPLINFFPYNTTNGRAYFKLPVTMRTSPTGISMLGSAPAANYGAYSTISFDRANVDAVMPNIGGSGYIAGGGNMLYGAADGTTYIEITGAEL